MAKIPFWIIFGAGLAIRLGLACFSAEVADTANYRRVAETLQQGGRLYTDTPAIYPYPPVWWLVEVVALWLAQHTPLRFVFWVELLPILADMGIVYLLYCFTKDYVKLKNAVPALYALNPLPILVCAVQGQFDALPVFFSLLALYLLQHKKAYYLIALALTIAVMLKAFPILLLPLFLFRLERWRQRFIFAAITVLPILFILMPYFLSDFPAVQRELLSYSGYPDQGWVALAWGVYKLLISGTATTFLEILLVFSKFLFLTIYAALLYQSYRRRNSATRPLLVLEVALVFALFYICYGGLSSQYLLWLLPFLLLLNMKDAIIYTLIATLALLAFYNYQWPVIIYRAPLQILPGAINAGLWLACTGMWWLAVVVWLARQQFKVQPTGQPYGPSSKLETSTD